MKGRLGWMLRQQRKAMGLTQMEIAERLGVCRATINKLERKDADGKIQPILEAYGVAIRENIFTTPQLYTVRREAITKAELKTWAKIDKLIRKTAGLMAEEEK